MTNWILFYCLLATSVGQSVVLSLLPSLGRSTGLTELQVASILSLSALVFALGTTMWSHVSVKLGRRRTLMFGLTGYCIGTVLFASVFYLGLSYDVNSLLIYTLLISSRLLQSCVMSATPPSVMGYVIATTTPERLLPKISRLTSANSLGQIIGPMLAGLLVGFGLLVPLYTIVIFTLFALVLVWQKLPEDKVTDNVLSDTIPVSDGENYTKSSSPMAYIFVAASLFCAMAMTQQTLGFFFMDSLNLTPTDAAKLVGFGAMITAMTSLGIQFFLISRLSAAKQVILLWGLCLLTMGYSLLSLGGSMVTFYFGMALLGVGMGLSYPSATSLAIGCSSTHGQATITGLVSASPAIGYVVGPPIAALLYQQNIYFPFYTSTTLIVSLAVFCLFKICLQSNKSNY